MSDPAGHSTLTGPELKSGAAWLASATPEEVDEFLSGLSQNALLALPWVFEFWALPHQLPPRGAWKTWVIMGGRGAGKTRAGAEWVRAQVEGARPCDPGRTSRLALVGDVLFKGSIGRADFPKGDFDTLIASIHGKLWPLGDDVAFISGHGPMSTIGYERRTNPFCGD